MSNLSCEGKWPSLESAETVETEDLLSVASAKDDGRAYESARFPRPCLSQKYVQTSVHNVKISEGEEKELRRTRDCLPKTKCSLAVSALNNFISAISAERNNKIPIMPECDGTPSHCEYLTHPYARLPCFTDLW